MSSFGGMPGKVGITVFNIFSPYVEWIVHERIRALSYLTALLLHSP